jgi:hypothetical protein
MFKEGCKTEEKDKNIYKMGRNISVKMETKKEERGKDESIR